VNLKFDSSVPYGNQLGWIRIETNHSQLPVIEIPFRARVVGDLMVQGHQLDFGIVAEGQPATAEIRLKNIGDRQVEVLNVDPHLPVPVDIVLEHYDQDYLIIVELADPPPLQNLAGHLNVYTDDPLQPVVQVPVVGWVSSMNPFELVSAAGDDSRLQALIEDALFREDSVPADAFIPSILGGVTDERAVSLLLKALEHQNWHYRERAVEVLGLLQNRLALEAVRRAVTDDLDEDVRAAAAAALVRIVGKEAYPELVLALQDHDSWVREDAAYLLGNLGDSRAIPPLKQALSDEDEDVRQAAAEALEMLHNKNHARQSGQSLEVD
jgi:hypothetical protein